MSFTLLVLVLVLASSVHLRGVHICTLLGIYIAY